MASKIIKTLEFYQDKFKDTINDDLEILEYKGCADIRVLYKKYGTIHRMNASVVKTGKLPNFNTAVGDRMVNYKKWLVVENPTFLDKFDIVEIPSAILNKKVKVRNKENDVIHELWGHRIFKKDACDVLTVNSVIKGDRDKFMKFVFNKKHNHKYEYTFGGHNYRDKVLVECPIHGAFEQKIEYHIIGCGCPTCDYKDRGGRIMKPLSEIKKRCGIIHQSKYEYDLIYEEGYRGIKDKVDIYCKNCEKVFNQRMGAHLQGMGCPTCRISKGEEAIKEYLEECNIDYCREWMDHDCYGKKRKLKFDFYLPDMDTCIEFDGEQHSRYVEYFGGMGRYEAQKKNDNLKNAYCQCHDINLIRIPYNQLDDIQTILKENLPQS